MRAFINPSLLAQNLDKQIPIIIRKDRYREPLRQHLEVHKKRAFRILENHSRNDSRFTMRRASIEKKGAQPKAILIGYARVSTEDQNLELQLSALKKAGCNKVFTDKTSGAGAERAGLKEALSHLRETDTLVVWKLDRLGRSVKGLVDLVIDLQNQQVHSGLESARRQGRVGGRKRLMTERKVNAAKKLLAAGTPPREIAQNLGVSVPTFYRWLPASSKN